MIRAARTGCPVIAELTQECPAILSTLHRSGNARATDCPVSLLSRPLTPPGSEARLPLFDFRGASGRLLVSLRFDPEPNAMSPPTQCPQRPDGYKCWSVCI